MHSILDDSDEYDNYLFNNCAYYETDNISQLGTSKSSLKAIHLNIHSLPTYIEDLKLLLEKLDEQKCQIDLIMLCETFLTDLNSNKYKIDGYTLVELHRSKMRQGGVAIFVRNGLNFRVRDDLNLFDEGFFESIFIEITMPKRNLIAGEIYRVPNTSEQSFLAKYEQLIGKINKENKSTIISTDQNLDYLKIDKHSNTNKFLDINLGFGLLPTITKPTRITHSSATLIDNIYIKNSKNTSFQSGIIATKFSDHLPCILAIDNCISAMPADPITITYRDFSESNLCKIKDELGQTDWSIIYNSNANDSYNLLLDHISAIVNKYAPEKTKVIHPNRFLKEAWMTKGFLKSSKTCDKLFKNALGKESNHPDSVKFRQYRNKFNSLKRSVKRTYYLNKLQGYKNNTSKLWKTMNTIIGRNNDKSGLSDTFIINGQSITDPRLICQGFCDYFGNIGIELASKIPNSSKHYAANLNDPSSTSFFLSPTDPEEVAKMIKSLPSKTSYGHDGLSNILIKYICDVIKVPFTHVVNQSFVNGVVPTSMKIAKVIPIYKAKDKKEFSNHRPISVLPVMSKILEKLVHKRLYLFLSSNNVLYQSQYGFRSSHSTNHAVTELISEIHNALDNKEVTLAVFLDLSKAFDTINHEILLKKLEYYGVRGIALDWFKNYLYERKQYVQYKSAISDTKLIECGVPQGSVLGPLLFILYTNDLPKALPNTSSILFADDTTVHKSGKNVTLLFAQMKADLAELIDWFRANKLSLNLNKTNYILFRSKSDDDFLTETLQFGTEILQRKHFVKFLGLLVDEFLEWTEQGNAIKNKIKSSLYLLSTSKNFLTIPCKKILYYSLIHSHLTQGMLLWGSQLDSKLFKSLVVLQKKSIRAVCNKEYNAHTRPLFKKLKLLTLTDLVKLETLKFMYSFVHSNLPQPLLKLFQLNSEVHGYNTRNKNNPRVNFHSFALFGKSFLKTAPSLWQTVDRDHQNSKTLKGFTTRAKRKCIELYT